MWDIFRFSTVGGFLLRKNVLILMAGLLSVLFVATVHPTSVFANGATWEGDTIKYQDKTYTKVQNPPTLPDISSTNQHIYQYVDPADDTKVSIIALKDDSDKTREITDAQFANFTKDQGNNYTSAGPPPTNVTIAASTGAAGANGNAEGDAVTGCAIDGIGWIICGPSRWIANGMDLIYGWISDFLEVKPLSPDTDNGMAQAWRVALGFANAMFIVIFLIIIYSHITSYGISNYEIKKLVPKLILVAILVNVSYYICAVAIDLSNILGNSVQSAMNEIRESLAATRPDGNNLDFNFKNITEFILSGGAIGAAGYAAYTAAAGSTAFGVVSSMAIMLVPVLVAGLLAVAVALIILAARQAIITVLVVIAPLAFVAYLLPNTEKWFEKWRGLFTTMLMVFPLFSLLFGGSQLASYLIMQNADQLTMILLALFVQVAPLALTPFLIQFSGSLLGRLAGMVNNPQKGILDRTSNWAKDRAETRAAEKREELAKNGIASGTWLQRQAMNRAKGQMNRDSWKKSGEEYTKALWHEDERYKDRHAATSEAELRSKYSETEANLHFEQNKARRGSSLNQFVQAQHLADDKIKAIQSQEAADWEAVKSNKADPNNRFISAAADAKAALRAQKIADGNSVFAQSEQSDEWAKLLLADSALQAKVGGIGGKDRALAQAVSGFRKNYGERIAEGKAVMDHYNFSATDRQHHAMGRTVHVDDGHGGLKAFRADSTYTREAAIDTQVRQGTVREIEEITAESGGKLKDFATTIQSAAAEAKISGKAVYFGGQSLDWIGQGKVVGQEGLNNMVRNTLLKGKVKAADLSLNEADALSRMLAVAQNINAVPQAERAAFMQKVYSMQQAAYEALTIPGLKGNVSDSARIQLNKMIKDLGGRVYDPEGREVIIEQNRTY